MIFFFIIALRNQFLLTVNKFFSFYSAKFDIRVKSLIIYFILISTKKLSIFFYVLIGVIVSNQLEKRVVPLLYVRKFDNWIELKKSWSKSECRRSSTNSHRTNFQLLSGKPFIRHLYFFYNDQLKRASNFSRYVSQRVCRTKLNII